MSDNGVKEAPPKTVRGRRSCLYIVRKFVVYVLVLACLAAVAACFIAVLAYQYVTVPGKAGEPIRITIPKGASGRQIGQILAKQGLIEHEIFFRLAVKVDGTNRIIRHGMYNLPKGLSPLELLRLLYEEPNAGFVGDRRLTIPEGLTITQMAQLFDAPEAFVQAASDRTPIDRLGVDALTLEGFLMPDTYFFAEKPSERTVVERMIEHFEKTYADLLGEIPEAVARDKKEIVTVASLVEEEARVDQERTLIAAVIYNRLKKNMPLQIDSTLQYTLGKYGQRLFNSDKEIDSPYNTYKYRGLPPGPISSPGKASLRAAMHPAQVDYVYFVSNADGKTHTFSTTPAEHEKAVARYRREIRKQRTELERQGENPPPE